MTDMRRAFRDLEGDLERARANLTRAIHRVPGADIDDIVIREEGEPTTIDTRELQELLDGLDDAESEIDAAFEGFDWEVSQALKTFKRQILTPGATS